MSKVLIRHVLAFDGLHAVVLMLAWLLCWATLPMFDDDWAPSMLGRFAEALLGALVMPGLAVLKIIYGESRSPAVVEWTLLILNSLVWGAGLACVRAWWKQRKRE